MGDKTGIAWTDATWNVTRGCRRVSAGCEHCYAERQAHRFHGTGMVYDGLTKLTSKGPTWTGAGRFVPEMLDQPLRWKRPRRIFVDSMSDLFFEAFTFEQIAAVFGVMAAANHHTFQVLTKRPGRALEFFRWIENYCTGVDTLTPIAAAVREAWEILRDHHSTRRHLLRVHPTDRWPLPNVVLGVSAENQEAANHRIPLLLQCPAAYRAVSAEPLLGSLDLRPWLGLDAADPVDGGLVMDGPKRPVKLDWVIAGGESGPKARPCVLSWIRNVVHDCEEAGVACFVKQIGAVPIEAHEDAEVGDPYETQPPGELVVLKHSAGADPAEWNPYLRVQQFPKTTTAQRGEGTEQTP